MNSRSAASVARKALPRQAELNARLRVLLASNWLPTGLLVLGLVLRLAVWWSSRGYEPRGDEVYYFQGAVSFAQTGAYSDPPTPAWLPIQRVPLFTLFVGAIFRVAGIDLGPVNLAQIGLSLGTCWLIWRWATTLWGVAAGRWALALAVLYPTFITHPASFLYPDSLFAFLAALSLYLLGRLATRSRAGADEESAPQSWPPLTRATLLLTLLSGVTAGLTALTRSSGILLVAVGLVWLVALGWRRPKRVAVLGLALIIGFSLTVAPWTIRNYQTYGGFLLLDTIGAYNLWRDNNFQRENFAAVLARVANPVEQQRIATEHAVSNLLTYPDRFLAKLPAAVLYLWHLELDSYARGGGILMDLTNRDGSFAGVLIADLAHLAVSALALVAIALAAGHGSADPSRRRLQLLLLLWIAANLVSGVVYHSEARYRIPYQPQLIVFAALPLVAWPAPWARARAAPWRLVAASGLLLLLLAGAWSPRLLPVLHMQAWVAAGDLLSRWQPAAALGAYRRAVDAFPNSDRPYIILGDARFEAGDHAGAVEAYTAALAIEPHNVNAAVPLVHLYQQAGRMDDARRILKTAGTSDVDLVKWAWSHYEPPPATVIDVGDGFEFGYVMNVYPPEHNPQATFRWTNGNGLLRLTVPEAGAGRLSLRFNGTRLTGPPARQVEVAINGRVVDRVPATGDWQTWTIDLAGLDLDPGADLSIEVRSDTFVPGSLDPGSRDHRQLGVAIDRVAIETS